MQIFVILIINTNESKLISRRMTIDRQVVTPNTILMIFTTTLLNILVLCLVQNLKRTTTPHARYTLTKRFTRNAEQFTRNDSRTKRFARFSHALDTLLS